MLYSYIKKFLILIHNNQLVVDFKDQSKLFNSFFTKQYIPIGIGSNLPTPKYWIIVPSFIIF